MRRIGRLLILLILVGAFAAPASAQSQLQQATGSGFITDLEIVSEEFAGPNRIEVRQITGQVFGDLQGTWTQNVRGVVHPDGRVTFNGTWEFTGEAGDCGIGTVSGRLTGHGDTGPLPDFPATTAQARITNQPSNTVPVVGQGTLDQTGPLITYDLQYRCR